jgi:Domain of unknown function (DUF4114)
MVVMVPMLFYHPDFLYNPVDTGLASNQTKLDGHTKPLTFVGVVEPNSRNKLVINVKDNRDGLLDSAVFLKAGTFGVTAPKPLDGSKPGVSIKPEDGKDTITITEGKNGAINIGLNGIPSKDVTVTIQPGSQVDLGNGAGKPVTVTFTPSDSYVPQTVTVTPVDDGILEGTHTETITVTTTSEDPNYKGLSTPPFKLQVNDPDGTGIPGNTTGVTKTPNDLILVSGSGSQVTLDFALKSANANYINELGVFIVDNDKGEINGIAPGQTGYLQAAMQRKQILLSALNNNPAPNFLGERKLNFAPGSYLNFYLVQNGSTEEVLTSLANNQPTPNVFFATTPANVDNFDHLQISSLAGNISMNWEDQTGAGDSDFDDLVINVKVSDTPVTIGTKLQGEREIIDLRELTGTFATNFTVNSEAAYNNVVGFYTIDDTSGRIGSFKPGDLGYTEAALQRSIVNLDRNATNVTGQFNGGTLMAPYIIANENIEDIRAGQNSSIYFAFTEANQDKADHIRLLGDNKFGFEDLYGTGDRDYNDIVLQVNFISNSLGSPMRAMSVLSQPNTQSNLELPILQQPLYS